VSVTIPAVGREVHLVARPVGEPTKADFALVDAPVAPPAADQVLVRNDWFSVDPYMRREFDQVVAGESVIMRSITRVTSAMMRSTSPETVGTWWISPCASPVLQIPASSLRSRTPAAREPATRWRTAAKSPPARSIKSTCAIFLVTGRGVTIGRMVRLRPKGGRSLSGIARSRPRAPPESAASGP
jgi:N-terminal domain of oxidoreductase